MPRSKAEPRFFEATVFIIGKKTSAGNVYPQSVADKIILDVTTGAKKYTVEEVAPVDREKNGVKPYESWPKRAMATCVEARMEDNRLVMKFRLYATKYGKTLGLVLDNNPMEKMEFYPVGIGVPDKDGVITNYSLSYVTFEVKK